MMSTLFMNWIIVAKFDVLLFRYGNAIYNPNTIERWTKGCILPFSKKGDIGIKRKNQNVFWRNRSTTLEILTIPKIFEGVRAKNLEVTLLFIDFSETLDFMQRGKMEQILLAYGLPKETVAAIMMLYKNTKVKVCSPDRDTDFFEVVTGVLQGDTLAPYLFIICLDYVFWTSIDLIKENGFTLKKKKKKGKKQTILRTRMCPWCNGYRRRKWTRRHEFKSWTKLIAFHIVLIPLGKVWIQLFSLQLWVNNRTDWVLQPW